MQPKISMKSKVETLKEIGERLNGTGDEAIKENLRAIMIDEDEREKELARPGRGWRKP